jgi:hypothetical protein
MGLIADYVEQARDGRPHHWFWRDQPQPDGIGDRSLLVPLPRKFVCSACRAELEEEGLLRRHVAAVHGPRFTYVVLNERVAQHIEVLASRPDCLKVVVGHEPIPAQMTVASGTTTLTLDVGENDLLPHLPHGFVGEVHIRLVVDGVAHDYDFAIGDTPSFRIEDISKPVAQLQMALDRGDSPDWNRYKDDAESLSPNTFEKRFLDGFLEYSLGFDMEKRGRWDHSAPHLESALHLLDPFGTRMAVTAKRVLGVRMNCFSVLRRCEPSSRFHLARLFFLGPEADPKLLDAPAAEALTADAVYCDGLTERLLAILKAFYAKDFQHVIAPCQQLRLEPAAKDRNNADKLDLVMARASHLIGDRDAARLYYTRVQDHPLFAQEAATYIRNGH